MQSRRFTAWNVLVNTGGVAVNLLAGLIVMPYLIQKLGASTYGLWSLIGSLTSYFGVLDFGVRPALGRLVAEHRARGEMGETNAVVSTAFVLLLLVSLIVLGATVVALRVFPEVFPVPAAQTADVRGALIIVGIAVAITFPAATFDGILWGCERFDLMAAVDIPAVILRTVLLFYLVSSRVPLMSLAAIALFVTVVSGCCKAWLCFRLERRLRIDIGSLDRSKIRKIYSYGTWMSVISWSRTLIPQIAPALIGNRIGTAEVTTYAVARQLVGYTNVFAVSATQVLTPRAIAAHALDFAETKRRLLLEGGRLSSALTFYFFWGLVLLGMPFIHIWQHGAEDAAYPLMIILLLGETLPISQWLTYSVLIGANKHRLVGILSASEAVLVTGCAWLAMTHFGLRGVCAAVALSGFAARGVARWIIGCRILQVGLLRYARYVFLAIGLASLPSALALYALVSLFPPSSLLDIAIIGLIYSIVFIASTGLILLGYSGLKSAVMSVLPTLQ